jgi:ketosteroid isomerase-like protein
MSARSNAALVREMHNAFGRRDLDGFLAHCTDDVRIHSDIGAYPPGHAGVRRWWADVIETFAVGTPRFGLIVELGDVVIALVEASWRGRSSGVEFNAGRVQVSRWRGGRVTWWGFYLSVEEAVQAAGLDATQNQAWSNVQTCLQVMDAVNLRDIERALAAYHPETELRPALLAAVEGIDVLSGRDGIRPFFENVWVTFDEFEIRPYEARWHAPDSGVVLARIRGRGPTSRIDVDSDIAWVITMRDELIYRQRTYLDEAEGLEAAGLSP